MWHCDQPPLLSLRQVAVNIISIIFFSSTIALAVRAQPKTYFVAPNGDDAARGESKDQPLRTIDRAIFIAGPGDTIYVLPGTYRQLITFSGKSGLPEKPICVIGYADSPDGYPVIDGGATVPSSTASFDWMVVKNSQWIEIARLTFRNGWTLPVKVSESSYLTFRSCQFFGGKRVINASGPATHHILVEDCYWDQGGEFLWRVEKDSLGVDAWTSMHHEALGYFNGSLIDFSGTGGSMVIRRNTVVNAYQAVRYRGQKGFDTNVEIYENHVSNTRDNDFEPEYYTYNLHIYHNYSHNIHRTLSVDNVEGGLIMYYGNVVTADTDSWTLKVCTGLWKIYGRPDHSLAYPLYAFNNSFCAPGVAFQQMSGHAMHLKHWNNAYSFLKGGRWDLNEWDASDEFDYDVSNRPWPTNLTTHDQETHGILGDPQFVDPSHRDLRLNNESKAIDAGKIVAVPEFDWQQSYVGSAPDMGAYEGEQLVEGPPFRFMVAPQGRVTYKEKPRIVRHKVEGNVIRIFFSDMIDAGSVNEGDFELYLNDTKLTIASVAFSHDTYEMVVETSAPVPPGGVSIVFSRWPTGMNGESATSWASEMKIHNKPVM